MKVRTGDVIGTTDGRYGEITYVESQQRFLVVEHYIPEDSDRTRETANYFWTNISEVASIR